MRQMREKERILTMESGLSLHPLYIYIRHRNMFITPFVYPCRSSESYLFVTIFFEKDSKESKHQVYWKMSAENDMISTLKEYHDQVRKEINKKHMKKFPCR
jgi:hypothetical protein